MKGWEELKAQVNFLRPKSLFFLRFYSHLDLFQANFNKIIDLSSIYYIRLRYILFHPFELIEISFKPLYAELPTITYSQYLKKSIYFKFIFPKPFPDSNRKPVQQKSPTQNAFQRHNTFLSNQDHMLNFRCPKYQS